MQAASIYFDSEEFFQSNIAQVNAGSEEVQQCELTFFHRRFENDMVLAETVHKPFRQLFVQSPTVIE